MRPFRDIDLGMALSSNKQKMAVKVDSFKNEEIMAVNCMPAKLLGVLSAYISYKDVLISQQTRETKMIQTENSGLTVVYPVDRIKEVVLLDWNRHREGAINTYGTYIAENIEKGQVSNIN